MLSASPRVDAAADAAGQEAAEIVAGTEKKTGVKLTYNEKTLRLEVRDELGNLLEDFSAGAHHASPQ